ncbi:MAG: hypothetical protein PF693_02630 [Spirochaetia bacterium]|jgi:uncharacterized membrane protein affecting hemolysin expression|nr:hypothetical protein [Spirochaetia bacterium]
MKKYLGIEFRLITLSLLIMIVSIVSILIVAKARTDKMVDQQIQNTNKLILSSLDWAVSPLLEAGDIDSIQRLIENIGASSAVEFLRLYKRDFTILASSNPGEVGLQELNTVVDEIFWLFSKI